LQGKNNLKVLFWNWSNLRNPSGTPSVLRDCILTLNESQVYSVSEKFNLRRLSQKVKFNKNVVLKEIRAERLWPFNAGKFIFRIFLIIPYLTLRGIFLIWFQFRPNKIVTVIYNESWIISSYLISKICGIPILYYIHDPFEERYKFRSKSRKMFARYIERVCLTHGNVAVLYDKVGKHYQSKYNINYSVLPHMIADDLISVGKTNFKYDIGFAGAIYENNILLLKKIILASSELGLTLRLFTSRISILKDLELENLGHVSIDFKSDKRSLIEGLSECKYLYLPLSFKDTKNLPRECLKFAFPTKLSDYLCTDSTIILHCPEDFVIQDFMEYHSCGHAIYVEDLQQICKRLEEINKSGRTDNSSGRNFFDRKKIGKQFINMLDL